MKKTNTLYSILVIALLIATLFTRCTDQVKKENEEKQVSSGNPYETSDNPAVRGKYIVTAGLCNDCHSPKIMTDHGPIADTTKLLSGHPAGSALPPADTKATQPGNWMLMSPDATSFVGPWGISYTANLTPDSATGIGAWTEEQFINTLRTGKHLGLPGGRDILPPMPWNYIAKYTDADLKAIFAYLKSLPAISNRVPAPVPPNEIGKKS